MQVNLASSALYKCAVMAIKAGQGEIKRFPKIKNIDIKISVPHANFFRRAVFEDVLQF